MNIVNKLQLSIFALLLAGCNPFNQRTEETENFIEKADLSSKAISSNYKAKIRKVKPYEVYRYQAELKDPFRIRQFLIQEQKKAEQELSEQKIKNRCIPPKCVPPAPHEQGLLEAYSLNDLAFVGTLGKNNSTALIRTPSHGIISTQIGDYIGKNNGKIQNINESTVVLQEKIHKNGLWENKKTILVITR